MPLHHPNDNLLVEYAAGTLPLAQAVAIKSHLHFCTECQQKVKEMERVGGALLENLNAHSLSEDSFEQLMSAIDNHEQAPNIVEVQTPKPDRQQPDADLPEIIHKLMTQTPLKWKKVTRTLQTAPLTVGQKHYEVALQRIKAGDTVPEHDHRGMEITVVLEGSFSDKQGIYQRGDFLVKNPGEVHQPISARNQDCLCLAVQEAPVKLTGLLGKLLNPFIRLRAA